MKVLLLILSGILFSISANAQNFSDYQKYIDHNNASFSPRIGEPGIKNNSEEIRRIAWRSSWWDTDINEFIATDSIEYSYNEQLDQTEALFKKFDGSIWSISSRRIYFYDDNGNLLTSYSESWDGLNYYIPEGAFRRLSTFDENNELLTSTFQFYEGGNWASYWRELYNTEENILLVNQELVDGNWENLSRTLLVDENNQGQVLIQNHEEFIDGEWQLGRRNIYEYDSAGNQISQLNQNLIQNNWVNDSRSTREYNSANLMTFYKFEFWSTEMETFINTWMEDWFFNELNEFIGFEFSSWDESISNWIPVVRNERLAFEKGVFGDYLVQEWSIENNEWVNQNFDTDYFGLFVSTKESLLPIAAAKVFPNPSNGEFTIELTEENADFQATTLSVYDMLGQMVIQTPVNMAQDNIQIDLSTLQSGFYLISLSDGVQQVNNRVQVVR